MKTFLTFLSLCFFTYANVAQTQQLSDKAEIIKRSVLRAKSDSQVVTIKVKQGARLGDYRASDKPLPKSKTITGNLVYTSDGGLIITSLLGEQTYFVYFEDIDEAKVASRDVVRWSRFGKTMASVGRATIAIPALFVGLCGPCGCVWD